MLINELFNRLPMKKQLIFCVTIAFLLATFIGCKKEAGDPFVEKHAFTIPAVVAPANGQFVNVTGSTVELKWQSTNGDNDPDSWDVYFGESANPPLVKAGNTTQSYTVTVEKGKEYNWYVEGVNKEGIPTRGEMWSFEVVDPAAPMEMSMSWTSNSADKIGMEIDPLQVANLRLRILKADKTTAAVTAINTAGFESYNKFNNLPDGKYYIATDLTSTIDAGDFNNVIDLDIKLQFSQRGVQEEEFDFPKVMTNQFVCSAYRVYLGYLVKTGTSYVFTKEVSKPTSPYSGTWYGIDKGDVDYDSEVVTYMGCSLQIKGLVNGWMSEFWGEEIVKGGSASITIDATAGTVDIPLQYYCTTKYKGVVQPVYNIVGTGTYDATGAFPKMTIQYTLIQGTDDWGQWMFDEGYMATNKFEAVLTLDPAGLPSSKSMTIPLKSVIKPYKH